MIKKRFLAKKENNTNQGIIKRSLKSTNHSRKIFLVFEWQLRRFSKQKPNVTICFEHFDHYHPLWHIIMGKILKWIWKETYTLFNKVTFPLKHKQKLVWLDRGNCRNWKSFSVINQWIFSMQTIFLNDFPDWGEAQTFTSVLTL